MIRRMDRRFRAVAIVVALAAIAVTVISNRHHHRSTAPGVPVTVLVAAKPIQKGTTGDAIRAATGLYKAASFSQTQVQSGALVNADTLVGKVALVDIPANAQLTAADFGRSCCSLVGELIRRAVVIASPKVIGGPIAAGNHVDVRVSGHGNTTLRGLYRNMRILAVSGDKVTLEAMPRQAGKLIYVMQSTNDRVVLQLRK